MPELPEELHYTADHLWLRPGNGEVVRIGLTEPGTTLGGQVEQVRLVEEGTTLSAGDSCGEVDFPERTWDLLSPVAGEVVAVNTVAEDDPGVVRDDPYGEGWLVAVRIDDAEELDELLDSDAYAASVD